MKRRRIWIVAAWCALFALAMAADRPVATWVHDSGLAMALKSPRWHWLAWSVRRFGNFPYFTLVATAWLLVLGPRWRKPAGFVLLSGALVLANSVVKWMVGRARPFQGQIFQAHPFVGGLSGLGGANQSFPSGDVCLAAATATSLAILFPRRRAAWAAVVILVAMERVAEGAHYPTDVTAGAALGCALAYAAWRMLGRPTQPHDRLT